MNDQIKTVFLLGLLSTILIGMGAYLGQGYFYGFTIMAIVMNFVSYFYSDKIVLAVSGAQEVTMEEAPRLHSIVEELAARANVPKPRVYIIPQAQPNAFATGRNPQHSAVAVTQGIMQLLNERELRGVIAHELGHVLNRDILITSIAATIASAVTFIAQAIKWSTIFGRNDEEEGGSTLGTLALAIVAPIAATFIQLGISRSREFEADATGARLCGDPESLARALEKLEQAAEAIPADVAPATASLYIVNPFAGTAGWFSNLFSTHPPMEERIARLRAMMLDGAKFA
jgi:heat shock protein HtpX